jgi:hypothetical protein
MNEQALPTQEQAITLVELQNILTVVDIASSRGAFRGPELEQIGQLYNKIRRFIDSAAAKAPSNTQEGM